MTFFFLSFYLTNLNNYSFNWVSILKWFKCTPRICKIIPTIKENKHNKKVQNPLSEVNRLMFAFTN